MVDMLLHTKRLTDKEFRKYCAFVYDECGIKLTEDKRELLNARMSKRLRKLGTHPDEYYQRIIEDPAERVRFVDAISTNHTYFFRESGPFDLIDHGCREIWCAASSSGEEPYSLAAHCYARGIKVSILATDISEACITKGRNALYPIERSTSIPEPVLKKCFQKGCNRWEGYFRVRPEIKRMVQFERFNLLKDDASGRQFDHIFCRNVMIYFDNPTKEGVVNKLARVLKPDGYFIIGGAESLNGLNHDLMYVKPSVYQKV